VARQRVLVPRINTKGGQEVATREWDRQTTEKRKGRADRGQTERERRREDG